MSATRSSWQNIDRKAERPFCFLFTLVSNLTGLLRILLSPIHCSFISSFLNNLGKFFTMGGALACAPLRWAPNYHYTTAPAFLSSGILHKDRPQKLPKFCAFCTLTSGTVCGMIIVSRGEGMKKQGVKPSVVDRCRNPAALEKKCKKPLDKLSRVCYTIDVDKEQGVRY